MKRIMMILLALLLALQCACGKKQDGNAMADAVQERLEQIEAKEQEETEEKKESEDGECPAEDIPAAAAPEVDAPAEEVPVADAPAAEAPVAEAPAEEIPAAPAEPSGSDVAVECGLLAEMMQTALIPLDWNNEYYEMVSAPVLATEPASLEGTWGYNPYGVSGVLVTDANDDGCPELILQAGEVEQQFYVFTVRDGAVHCVGLGLLENQNGDPYMTRFLDEENGCTILVSEGETGSGAGNYQFLCWVDGRDLGCREADFCGFDEYSEEQGFYKVYEFLGEEISEEEYMALREEFYGALVEIEVLEFTPLGENPAAVAAELLYLWAITR